MAVHLNQQDLTFILRQIRIAEAHASGIDLTELRVDPATGDIGGKRSWLRFAPGEGLPDGMTTDAQGRARLSAALSPPRAGTVSVVASGAQVQQQARLVLVDTGGAPVDQNSRTGGQRDDEVRLPVLSARHTWLLLGGVLVLMTAAAVALRPRRGS